MTHQEAIERLAETERLLGVIPNEHGRPGNTDFDIRQMEIRAYFAKHKDSPAEPPACVEAFPGTFVRREVLERADREHEALGDRPVVTPQPQDESSGVNAFFGTLVTDETDKEIREALGEAQSVKEMIAKISATVPDSEWAKEPTDASTRSSANEPTADELLAKVHERLGNEASIIIEFGSSVDEIRWSRVYNEDERPQVDGRQAVIMDDLAGALQSILDHEDEADRAPARKEGSEYDYEADCEEADAADRTDAKEGETRA